MTRTRVDAQTQVVDLREPEAQDPRIVGSKAANLALATRAGLPALPGFVVTVKAANTIDWEVLSDPWRRLSDAGRRPLVVRSSSPNEDQAGSSMAGRFTSVVGASGWDAFATAVNDVVASGDALDLPVAVLVQPMVEPRYGGVLFGAHPVTGATDRLVVSAVRGTPDQLVAGRVDGAHLELAPSGRVLDAGETVPAGMLRRRVRRRLADLARRSAELFGGPQDLEWAIDGDDAVVLLQARPITTVLAAGTVSDQVFGPGPVAETFPEPLTHLEEQLWAEPLRDALGRSLRILGRKPPTAPLLVAVDGRVAVDLATFEGTPTNGTRRWLRRIDPRPPLRRLRSAWRVGRLRASLPQLSRQLIARLDQQLADVPDLASLSETQLVGVLDRGRQALAAVHGYEIVAGQLLDTDDDVLSAASEALRLLVQGRADGLDDPAIAERWPVVLALVPARIGAQPSLPPVASAPPPPEVDHPDAAVREALRLRVRWLHELTARAACELGARLSSRGVLDTPELVAAVDLDEVRANVSTTDPRPVGVWPRPTGLAALPARFRLDAEGRPVPVPVAAGANAGAGAGGGRSSGPVHQGDDQAPAGSVLVVRTLDPSLASRLPDLGGLVSETGSVLSHVAILARELGVPTVVAYPEATRRFAPGATVSVDGITGEVTLLDALDREESA